MKYVSNEWLEDVDTIPVRLDYFNGARGSEWIKTTELRQFIADNYDVASVHEIYESDGRLYWFFLDIDV